MSKLRFLHLIKRAVYKKVINSRQRNAMYCFIATASIQTEVFEYVLGRKSIK